MNTVSKIMAALIIGIAIGPTVVNKLHRNYGVHKYQFATEVSDANLLLLLIKKANINKNDKLFVIPFLSALLIPCEQCRINLLDF